MAVFLVDSSVVLDLGNPGSRWFDWSASELEEQDLLHSLIINPIIYAEVSIGFSKIESCEAFIEACGFGTEEIPREALFLAGKAFLNYRRSRRGTKATALPDFFIGAHAAVGGYGIITRDPGRIKSYFPTVRVVSPG